MNRRPRLLFLAHLLPWPLDGGGQIKSFHTLKILASRFDITLLAFVRKPEEAENIAALQPLCQDIRTVLLRRSRARDARGAIGALLSGRSFIISRDDVPEMRRAVQEELAARQYAAVHVDHLQMAQFVPDEIDPCVVLDHHNIEHRIPRRMAETADSNRLVRWYAAGEWPRLRDYEKDICRQMDRVLTVSEEDREALAELAPDASQRTVAVPIGVDTEFFGTVSRNPASKTLLSIGTMYWPPNVDSILYFCREILPIIKKTMPEVQLNIVGARPTRAIQALAQEDDGVHVTGSVPDIRDWAAECGAFIVPLRSGSGMRVKILNAMAMGLPVVSTSIGAEGIDVTDGEDILLADGAEAFAEAALRLLADPALAERIAANGQRLMREQYSWESVGRRLLAVYDDLVPSIPSAPIAKGQPS